MELFGELDHGSKRIVTATDIIRIAVLNRYVANLPSWATPILPE